MSTTISLPLLDQIHVASPCTVRWEDMPGDNRTRRCEQCNLNVHNISALTRDEAEQVLQGLAHGRVCGWFYRRADGTILTQDCPVGLAKIRAKARRAMVRIAMLLGLIGSAGVAAGMTARTTWGDRVRLRAMKPFSVVCEWIAPTAAPVTVTGRLPSPPGMLMPRPTPPTPTPPVGPSGQASGTGAGTKARK
jgi:hypothetical protein